jgi:hypothetical protein
MKKVFASILALFSLATFAQFNPLAPWMENSEKTTQTEKTFKELSDSFNSYWSTKDFSKKGSGYKPFKRWENHWSNSTNDQGFLISPQEMWAAWQQKNNNSGLQRSVPVCNWEPLGPFSNAVPQTTRGRGRVNVVCVDPTNANTIYMGAPAGGIWKSIDAGASWIPLSDNLPQIGVSGIAVDYQDPNTIYIATGDKDNSDTYSIGVMKSTDGGITWNTTGLAFTNTFSLAGDLVIHPTNNQILWCATSSGVYKTSDGGTTWAIKQTGNFAPGSIRLKPGNPTIVYATSKNKFFKSTNSGDTFSSLTTGFPSVTGRIVMDVTAANPEYIYCLLATSSNAFQGIYKSTNGGTSWANTGLSATTTDIFDEGVQAWYNLAICVSQTNPNEIYTGNLNIWKSIDGGATATAVNNWNTYSMAFTHADIHFLRFFGDKLYCGSDGGIYVSSDGGTIFNDIIGAAQIGQFYKISVSKQTASKITGGLQDNGGFIYNNSSWQSYHPGDGMDTAIDPSNSNKCYGFVYNGAALFASNDNGLNLSAVVLSPSGESGDWVTPLRANSVGEIFAGYSQLFKLNFGAWSQQNSATLGTSTIQNITVDPSNDDIMYISKGRVLLKSTNKGVAFTTVYTAPSNITSIAVNYSNSNIVYITTSGTSGKAWSSTNGGTTFAEIAPGLPAIGKNIIVHQGRNSINPLYVGTSLGVYYKDDTMSTWETFDTNLPNVSVTDLEINLDDSKLIAGTYGRGVWQCSIPYEIPAIDIKLASVESPISTISCGGSFAPQITLKNNGSNAISTVTINYNYDGTPQTYTWNGTIAPSGTQSINLPPFTVNMIGAYKLSINTTTTNDAFADNNLGSVPFYVNNAGTVGITNTFETPASSLLTYNDEAIVSQWQRGIRAAGTLASGSGNVYTTSLSGNYPDETKSYLVSQCYDLTQTTNPVIRFKMAFDLEVNWDVVYVQYTTDFGQSWTVLGSVGPNWYNSNRTPETAGDDCYNCPGAQWSGTDFVLKEYNYPLNTLTGFSNVIFRIVFQSDQAVTQLGVVIDDFVIDGILSTQQMEINSIAIYPNPSKGIFNIEMGSILPKTIEVYDLTGKIVYSKKDFSNNSDLITLNLSAISNGIYFVKIAAENQSVTKRILKN